MKAESPPGNGLRMHLDCHQEMGCLLTGETLCPQDEPGSSSLLLQSYLIPPGSS